jgi:hypothetical protein
MSQDALRRWQRVIVLIHIALALVYSAVVPPFEAYDETGHFDYIQQLHVNGALPRPGTQDAAFLDQSHQPPAYYLLAGAATAWIDFSDYARPTRNVFAFDGSNRRGLRILLPRAVDAWPWRGSTLALHVARAVSTTLSGLMLLAIAACMRIVFATRPGAALLATATAAFNPQVLFMAAIVNNDVMVSLCGAVAALLLMRLAISNDKQLRTVVMLGSVLGGSVASKNSAVALLAYGLIVTAGIAWRARWTAHETLVRGTLLTGAAALFVVPHVARNLALSGRPLLDRAPENVAKLTPQFFSAGLNQALQDAWLPRIFTNAFRTFWGAFGWGNLQQPELAYVLYAVLAAAGVFGALLAWRNAERAARSGLTVLLGLAIAMAVLPTYRAIAFQDPALLPGRYLLPSLSAHVALIGFGLTALLNTRLTRVLMLVLAAWAGLIPLVVLRPAYAPSLRTADSAPAVLTFTDAQGAPIAEITKVEARSITLDDREGPRHYARIRLSWRAVRATREPLVIGVAALGYDAEPLGSINVHPQRGNWPSTLWRADDAFTDEYDVLIEKPCARLPTLGRVAVALFTLDAQQRVREKLSARSTAGDVINPVIGRFKVDAPTLPYPIHWQEAAARFDGTIGLRDVTLPVSATAGAPLRIAVNYELLAPTMRDATVFVHALDPEGGLVAQDDHVPANGTYPLSLWDAGQCAREVFTLNIPAAARGPLRIVTGWYDTQGRLRATRPTAPAPTDDLIELGQVDVTR